MAETNIYTRSQRQPVQESARHHASKLSTVPDGRGFLEFFHPIINHCWLPFMYVGSHPKSIDGFEFTGALFVADHTLTPSLLMLPRGNTLARSVSSSPVEDSVPGTRCCWSTKLYRGGGFDKEVLRGCSHRKARFGKLRLQACKGRRTVPLRKLSLCILRTVKESR